MTRIGVDLDGVVCDLLTPWLDKYNKIYNDNLRPEDITEWELEPFVKPECGRKIFEFLDDSVYDDAPEIPDAVASLKRLVKRHDVYIVTACGPRQVKGKWQWIRRHLPFLRDDNIIICNQKFLVKVDLLIDDYPGNLWGAEKHGIVPMLFAAPHNEKAVWPYTRY